MKIIEIKKVKTETVYDITVDNAHHYILENGVVTHNSGLQYAASSVIFLSKRKEKDGDEVIGNIIHCKNTKNRFVKENKKIDVLLTYDKGLNRYYGLVELALASGLFKKETTRIQLPDGTKVFEKKLINEPEKYFTQEVLDQLEQFVKKSFIYGAGSVETSTEGEENVVQ